MSAPDHSANAAIITAALIARKPESVEVTTADAAKLYWAVRQALMDAAPKVSATTKALRA